MNISEKAVNGYAENKLASKIAPWYAMIISWAIAPFMFFKFLRYKKRYIVFPLLYILAIIATVFPLYGAISSSDYYVIEEEYCELCDEVTKDTFNYIQYQEAKKLFEHKYILVLYKECDNMLRSEDCLRNEYIDFINRVCTSEKPIYALEREDFEVVIGNSATGCSVYKINDSPLVINSMSEDVTNDELNAVILNLFDTLETWSNAEYIIEEYNNGAFIETNELYTIFNEETLTKIEEYEQLIEEKNRRRELVTIFLPTFGAVFCGVAFAAMVTMSASAGKKNKQVELVEKEVLAGRGKTACKEFVNCLRKLSQARNAEEFNRVVAVAHADYELRKDIILTKSQMKDLTQEIVVASAILDGKLTAKEMRKKLRMLYVTRDFEQISEISQTHRTRLNIYKENLVKEQSSDFVLEYDGKSTFDGTVLQRIGWALLCNFVTVITLGIAYPVTLCWKMRWQATHTIYNGKRLSFDGKGIQLLGKWILWGLLTIVTLGMYGFWVAKKLEQWKAKHTHIAGEFAVLGGTFDGSVAGNLGWNILNGLLSIVTLGIAVPFVMCWKMKWLCKHRIYDGKRLNFDGNGAQLIGKYLLWLLLTVVTLGIYGLWLPNKILQWQASHTTLNEDIECVL